MEFQISIENEKTYEEFDRPLRHITLLQTANLPHKFWFHACAISVYFINKMVCQTLHISSHFQCLFGSPPSISHLRVFDCACFPLLKQLNFSKLQPKTSQCIFIGYASQYKWYLCLNPLTNKIFVYRHVLFDETSFPYNFIIASHNAPSHPTFISPQSQSLVPHSLINSQNTVISTIPIRAPKSSTSLPTNVSDTSTTATTNA